MSDPLPSEDKVVELDSRRPHVNEMQLCHNCWKYQLSTHLADVKREWWECTHCGELAAKAEKS